MTWIATIKAVRAGLGCVIVDLTVTDGTHTIDTSLPISLGSTNEEAKRELKELLPELVGPAGRATALR